MSECDPTRPCIKTILFPVLNNHHSEEALVPQTSAIQLLVTCLSNMTQPKTFVNLCVISKGYIPTRVTNRSVFVELFLCLKMTNVSTHINLTVSFAQHYMVQCILPVTLYRLHGITQLVYEYCSHES